MKKLFIGSLLNKDKWTVVSINCPSIICFWCLLPTLLYLLQVLALVNNPHYLYRMTILVAIGNLAPVVSHDVLCSLMLPVVVASSEDKVPNIKFNVAKMLKQLIPLVDNSVWNEVIKPCLLSLSEDEDVDVRYFANQAMNSCELITAE